MRLSLRGVALVSALSMATAVACGSSSGGGAGSDAGGDATSKVCTPGQQVSCACPGSTVTGAQVCGSDGTSYGACMGCPGSGSSSGASGSSSGASSGSSSGSLSGGSSGGSSGSSSGGTTDAANDSPGGDASCDGGELASDCVDCVNASAANANSPCTSQAATCSANTDCQNLNQCVGTCGGSSQCIMTCQTTYPNGVADFAALTACVCQPCVCKQTCAC